MMMRREKGFTLVELLAAVAIIGILAAMLFPVLARARESARTALCLSNVKNIALAIQMYLADNNDTLPPAEGNPTVLAFLNREKECGTMANPYLRWPVILDEYVKSRAVWRCPNSKQDQLVYNVNPGPDWFGALVSNAHTYGHGSKSLAYSCPSGMPYWPSGWGGSITDSFVQERSTRGDPKAFGLSIGVNALDNYGRKPLSVEQLSTFVTCGDAGWLAGFDTMRLATAAYPDVCKLPCAACDLQRGTSRADPAERYDQFWGKQDAVPQMITDVNERQPYARHFGGVNLGFLDGHAAWWNSETLLSKVAEGHGAPGTYMGLNPNHTGPGNEDSFPISWCVVGEKGQKHPTLY